MCEFEFVKNEVTILRSRYDSVFSVFSVILKGKKKIQKVYNLLF